MNAIVLTPAERRRLKAQAHSLHPVVMVGDKGVTEAVLREIDVNLKSHELIKIKVASDDRDEREGCLARICEALSASPVQHIGKTLVIYRENPEPPPSAPPARPRKAAPKRASKTLEQLSAARPAAARPAAKPKRSAPGKGRSARRAS